MFKVSDLYREISDTKEKIIVLQGGTSSGKTYSTLQRLFVLAIAEPNSIITVVGQDIPNLKKGAFRDATIIYNESTELVKYFPKVNQTDRIFQCTNGSLIEFSSFSDEQDAKSGKRDYLFLNEADGIPYEIVWQLAIRTRNQIFIDYNPTLKFWVHEKLIATEGTKLIISDHRHNPFITSEMHRIIESIDDPELFKVYARGLTGRLEGLIYTNWTICERMPQEYKYRWTGIDFGFTNDPTAIVDVRLSEGELWVDEIAYTRRLTNLDIYNILKGENITRIETVADSAEPKSIEELKRLGVLIEGAEKGKDSVNAGIDILKRYKLNITKRSVNIRKEINSYSWKKDKKTGDYLNIPVGFLDHAMSAIRYVALNKLEKRPKIGKIKFHLGSLWENDHDTYIPRYHW